MRVALVCPYSLDVPGGVATHVLGLGRWLARQGHEPLVIAPGTEPVTVDVEVLLVGASTGFRFNGSTANLGIRPSQARRVRKLVAQADVVHVHEPLTPGIAYAASRAAGRLVVTHHAHYTVAPSIARVLRIRARGLGKRVSIAVSDAAAATARAVTGEEPVVIPNAIDLPEATDKPRGAKPLVLFVGRRDDPRKGYSVFEGIAHGMPDEARFVAVGPGSPSSGAVEARSQVSPGELSRWLGESRVVVAPNLGGESFGLILVEALAHGCGLVASDLPAFRSVVGKSDVAAWFPPGDVQTATAALRRLLRGDPDPSAARAIARKFSWEVVGPSVLRQYAADPLG